MLKKMIFWLKTLCFSGMFTKLVAESSMVLLSKNLEL